MLTLTMSMPGCAQKMLVRFKHEPPPPNQYSPHQPQPKKYGKNEDDTIAVDNSLLLDKKRKKVVQQVTGTFLYYARAVDCTILPAISSIASTQAKATKETERRVKQLLDYLATLPNAKVRFHASKMVLNVHSDASYLSEPGVKSRAVLDVLPLSHHDRDGSVVIHLAKVRFTGLGRALATIKYSPF